MKRDQRAYLREYYKRNRAHIRQKQRQGYEAKYQHVSGELLLHLRNYPIHSLDRPEITCADCERLGPLEAVICLECGRSGLAQLSIHLREAHKISLEEYLDKRTLPLTTSVTTQKFHATRSRLSKAPEVLRRLKRFTPETARAMNLGRPSTLRGKRGSTRSPRFAVPRETKLSRRLGRSNVAWWLIAERRLAGAEKKEIAAELQISTALVNRRCREMRFPSGEPVYFWRGEAVGDRHLRELLKIGALTIKAAALRMGVKPHRLSRALSRTGRPLPLDLGQKTIAEMVRLKAAHRGPEKLLACERDELHWKAKVLRREIRILRNKLLSDESTNPMNGPALGKALCQLARDGRITTLFRWGREFLEWIFAQYDPGSVPQELARAFEVARDFLGNEYGVHPETIHRAALHGNAIPGKPEDMKRRRELVDLVTVFGQRSKFLTAELLPRLRVLGRAPWTDLKSGKQLGAILTRLGMRSRSYWTRGHVARGYDRQELKAYSTVGAAKVLDVAPITLKHYVWKKRIPLPPIVLRRGVRGRGSVRIWTDADILAARTALESRAPKHRRPPAKR
jgi:ROS/MUCR transcriptional regulator protein/Protein of unknown function (DUF3631)